MRLSKEKNQTYILKSKRLSSPFQYDANIIKKKFILQTKKANPIVSTTTILF